MLNTLHSGLDLLTVLLGFSLIIIVHELGHFIAARWAGIRVLAFAVGFGPAIASYRRGLGFRRGSSADEYDSIAAQQQADGVSTTEYRLNVLPLGGYVKMLGQEDADPSASSDAPDSYQMCLPWKRMVVISAGVVFNIILAALLFVAVFLIGLDSRPPVIGLVAPGSPAAQATPIGDNNDPDLVGLRPGDILLDVDGRRPQSFDDLTAATFMARKGRTLQITVDRDGNELVYRATPVVDPITKLLELGVQPAVSNHLVGTDEGIDQETLERLIDETGLTGLEPGMELVEISGQPAASPYALDNAIRNSGGNATPVAFATPDGARIETAAAARPELQHVRFKVDETTYSATVNHLLGLPGVLSVHSVLDESAAGTAGLQAGDVFAVLGELEWPTPAAGIVEIQSHKRRDIKVVIAREVDGQWQRIDLGGIPVSGQGRIGFFPTDSAWTSTFIGTWPTLDVVEEDPRMMVTAAANLGPTAGWRVLEVDGIPVASLAEMTVAVRNAIANASDTTSVNLVVDVPAGDERHARSIEWKLTPDAAAAIASLGWESPVPLAMLFKPEAFKLKASTPVGALEMGANETVRMMKMTYLTFLRLFQGSVKIQHLHGPVGIAHIGTILADKGYIWLLFFMAVISVNLAVINFLPMPIVDGGHFVYLVYEQITGRPPPIAFQNAAALAGLALIACVFLVVTFNDVKNLLGY